MSFATTLRTAVEEFTAKFAGQHRDAMQEEFKTAQAMMLEAHKSLNEAETALGLPLTPMMTVQAVSVVRAPAPVKVQDVEPVKVEMNHAFNLRKADRAWRKVKTAGIPVTPAAKRRRSELARTIVAARDGGMTWGEINRTVGRSTSWAHSFLRATREAGLI